MIAAIATVVGGKTRFFIAKRRESADLFIGRVSVWIRSQEGENLEMLQPNVLPEGVPEGEVIMRLKKSLGISRAAGDASEYDVENASLALDSQDTGQKPN